MGGLLREALRERRAIAPVLLWSAVAVLPALVSGRLVALAVDRGFLDGRGDVGLAWLGGLGLAMVVGAVGARRIPPALGRVVEPLRDRLVRRVVTGTLRRAAGGGRNPDLTVITRMSEHTEVVRDTAGGLLLGLQQVAFTVAAALIGLAFLAPIVALLVVPPVLLVAVLLVRLLPMLVERHRESLLAEERVAGTVGRLLGAVRDVVACGAEPQAMAASRTDLHRQARAERALARAHALRLALGLAGGHLALVTVLVAAPWLVAGGHLSTGEILGTLTYVTANLQPALRAAVQTTGGAGVQLAVTLHRLETTTTTPPQPPPDRPDTTSAVPPKRRRSAVHAHRTSDAHAHRPDVESTPGSGGLPTLSGSTATERHAVSMGGNAEQEAGDTAGHGMGVGGGQRAGDAARHGMGGGGGQRAGDVAGHGMGGGQGTGGKAGLGRGLDAGELGGFRVGVEGVTFGYGAEPVLRDVTFGVDEGFHLAVVGLSGVGKSTLASVLAGLVRPQRGGVFLGGVPLEEVEPTWRYATVALIPQEAYIFTGTLRENLVYLRRPASSRGEDGELPDPRSWSGGVGDTATASGTRGDLGICAWPGDGLDGRGAGDGVADAELDAVVEVLGLGELVGRVGGFAGRIGPRCGLTPGEMQLIALARVWLSTARVVILDEATCHLDAGAEARAEEAFRRRPGTLIVVAHRLTSARRADRILVLDGGRAVVGEHDGLLRESALYADLFGRWTVPEAPSGKSTVG
ncbi:ATP-binding cassette domain-containing protein [Actinomadura flavalba]|uniref:ATP-binding cassette domain-containing protein n=1 Tax=Actinomadura flavalba TaxID=1120938 RepID=UPI00035D5471|nr:ABC transporter ATP-binding protein [Actinomadura flavalba]